jgi:hypothetical protein
MGQTETETWQPRKVDSSKISKSFPYLDTTQPTAPLPQTALSIQPPNTAKLKQPQWQHHINKHIATNVEHQNFLNVLTEYKTSLLDSNYSKTDINFEITGPSNKQVMVAFGQTSNTTHQALLPMTQLAPQARPTDILPALKHNSY